MQSGNPISTQHEADLIVIGGGIYGVMLALEAGLRGRRALVLDRKEIGGATTASWFRILHGGFRYLQTLDVVRTRESAAERRWFLNFAPDLVRPVPFLMPLYGDGLRRPAALRAAFLLEAMLTPGRNRGLPPEVQIEPGRTLTPAATAALFPDVRQDGLRGAALWNDAVAADDTALMARLCKRASELGARFEENAPVEGLHMNGSQVGGVVVGGVRPDLRKAPVVINAAGPWSAAVAERMGVPAPELFRPSLAFNLLLDCAPLAETGLAVAGPAPDAPMLFLLPLNGRTFAGTWHTEWTALDREARVTAAEIDAFLSALADAAPALGAKKDTVIQIFAGLQPAVGPGAAKVSNRPMIIDHGRQHGLQGVFSVSGVKYTTARHVAATLLDRVERTRIWR